MTGAAAAAAARFDTGADSDPLSDMEFAARLAALGPFERAPRLAVAVSGGPDSLALAVLADRWARRRGGSAVALTVDHRLRPESSAEARQVGMWLTARGIEHHVLAWTGPKPAHGIQDAAREARRDLLHAECRRGRALHLLLGHHADDQTETLIMRAASGSGRDGLAGMAAAVEARDVRILRPLLDVPRRRLIATLVALGQRWVDDPSNRDRRFLRTVARDIAPSPQAAGTATAQAFGGERARRDDEVAALLAAAAAVHPEGWATLDGRRLCAAPSEIGRRALVRTLMCVGGAAYPPRAEAAERLHELIARGGLGGGRTLAGCRVLPRRHLLLVARELAAHGLEQPVHGPGDYRWDNRFELRILSREEHCQATLRSLGSVGWAALASRDKSLRALPIPPAVRPSLPAICDLEGVLEVPHLMYRRQGADPDSVRVVSARFRPRHVLAGAGFAVSPRLRDSDWAVT